MRARWMLAAAALWLVWGPGGAGPSEAAASSLSGTGATCASVPEPALSLPKTSNAVYSQTGPMGSPPWEGVPVTAADGRVDPDWTAQIRAQDAMVAAHKNAPLIFIGDSITARWTTCGAATWYPDFAAKGALDLGIGGDTTQNVLWRVRHGALRGLHPKTVVLLIGTNDYHHVWTPKQVAEGVVATADAIRRALPAAHVVVLALLPRDNPNGISRFDVETTDATLATVSFGPRISYLNINAHLLGVDGGQKPGLFDRFRVHPTAAGYAVMGAALEAYQPIGHPRS
jgi:lysophospholipase L1-like esterase